MVDFAKSIAELAQRVRTQSEGVAEAARNLTVQAARGRQSVRPRGTLFQTAAARIADESSLVTLIGCAASGAPSEVLRVAGELGGASAAEAIANLLPDMIGLDDANALRDATSALRKLGGRVAVDALANLAVRSNDERSPSLTALLDLAEVDSPASAEGGPMPTSAAALRLWDVHRSELVFHDLGATIALLDEYAMMNPNLAPRINTVREAVLTAAEQELRRFLEPTNRLERAFASTAGIKLARDVEKASPGAFVAQVRRGYRIWKVVLSALDSQVAAYRFIGDAGIPNLITQPVVDLLLGARMLGTATLDDPTEPNVFPVAFEVG